MKSEDPSVADLEDIYQFPKKILEEVAIIPSKLLRNKIAGFSTDLMKHIQKGRLRSTFHSKPVKTPVPNIGDIHGQFHDLAELFRIGGKFMCSASSGPESALSPTNYYSKRKS